jgi:hypothetical protein
MGAGVIEASFVAVRPSDEAARIAEAAELLQRVASLVAGGWCQLAGARSSTGWRVDPCRPVPPEEGGPVAFSLHGALAALAGGYPAEVRATAEAYLAAAADPDEIYRWADDTGDAKVIEWFNDDPARDGVGVLVVLAEAIQAARSDVRADRERMAAELVGAAAELRSSGLVVVHVDGAYHAVAGPVGVGEDDAELVVDQRWGALALDPESREHLVARVADAIGRHEVLCGRTRAASRVVLARSRLVRLASALVLASREV